MWASVWRNIRRLDWLFAIVQRANVRRHIRIMSCISKKSLWLSWISKKSLWLTIGRTAIAMATQRRVGEFTLKCWCSMIEKLELSASDRRTRIGLINRKVWLRTDVGKVSIIIRFYRHQSISTKYMFERRCYATLRNVCNLQVHSRTCEALEESESDLVCWESSGSVGWTVDAATAAHTASMCIDDASKHCSFWMRMNAHHFPLSLYCIRTRSGSCPQASHCTYRQHKHNHDRREWSIQRRFASPSNDYTLYYIGRVTSTMRGANVPGSKSARPTEKLRLPHCRCER